jgi:hypothetical protein
MNIDRDLRYGISKHFHVHSARSSPSPLNKLDHNLLIRPARLRLHSRLQFLPIPLLILMTALILSLSHDARTTLDYR